MAGLEWEKDSDKIFLDFFETTERKIYKVHSNTMTVKEASLTWLSQLYQQEKAIRLLKEKYPEIDVEEILFLCLDVQNRFDSLIDASDDSDVILEWCLDMRGQIAEWVQKIIQEKNQYKRGEHLKTKDHLTKIYDRKTLDKISVELIEIALELGKDLSFVFIDFDDFKQINDSNWHIYWDLILRLFSIYLDYFFKEDEWNYVFRYWWDEFLIISLREDISDKIKEFKNLIENWFVLSSIKSWNIEDLNTLLHANNFLDWFDKTILQEISFTYWIWKLDDLESKEKDPRVLFSDILKVADSWLYFNKKNRKKSKQTDDKKQIKEAS